jgi:hypothetical protein
MTILLPIGTRVRVTLFGGQRITATVAGVETNIKNDRPGYDLSDCSDGLDHWCYADQAAEEIRA